MKSINKTILELDFDPIYFVIFNVENSESFFFGKDPENNLIFLIKPDNTSSTISANSSRGKFLDISFNTTCEFKIKGKKNVGNFTLLTLKTDKLLLKNIFISLCSDLIELIGEKPSYDRVVNVVKGLRELFINFLRPAIKNEIGLWGELFVISQAKNIENAIDSWHINPSDTFDFNDGKHKMEVKTTVQNQRIHAISLNQILKSIESESLICSIMTSKIDLGVSVFELTEIISVKINSVYKQRLNEKVIKSAGDKWIDFTNKYDYSTAENSMKYYKATYIPKIDPAGIDPNISNVKFSVNLESTDDEDIEGMKVDCEYLPQ
ncbi:PD-(D/E)XK motif protein [Crocinitomicaceae bacterium]|nr:PD-(D/E)XK motif protein [Crocinitomicaceae bacterium]